MPLTPYSETEPGYSVKLTQAFTATTISTSSSCAKSESTDPDYPLAYWSIPGRVENGYKLSDWRDRVGKCLNAVTSYSVTAHEIDRSPSYYDLKARYLSSTCKKYTFNRQYIVEGDNFWWALATDVVAPSLQSQCQQAALSKFYKRAIEIQRQFSAGTFLGELRETLRAIRDPARSLRRKIQEYYRDYKRKVSRTNWLRARDFQRAVSDSWLEAVFGWTPLVKDVDDAMRALAERQLRLQLTCVRVKGKSTGQQATVFANNQVRTWGVFTSTSDQLRVIEAMCSYYGAMTAVPQGPLASPMLSTLGVRSWRDAVLVGWELLPYSFLLDYFGNIGDVLEAWAFQRSSLRWVGKVQVLDQTDSGINNRVSIGTSFYSLGWRFAETPIALPGRLSHNLHKVVREPLDPRVLEVPDLQFEIPGFGTRWINIGALIASRTADRAWTPRGMLPLEQRRIVKRLRRSRRP